MHRFGNLLSSTAATLTSIGTSWNISISSEDVAESQATNTSGGPRNEISFLPDIALVGVALIWGVNIPLMKSALGMLDNVFVYNAIRLPLSALVLTVFAIRERKLGKLPHPDVTWRHICVYSMMVSVAYQICFLLGMSLTTPGNTALIIATVPIWTALLARFFLGEKIPMLAWSGLVVAVVGTVIVAMQKGVSTDAGHLSGNLIVLFAALLWATGTVYSRPLLNRISPMQLAASASVIGLPVHILVAATQFESIEHVAACLVPLRSIWLWIIIVYSGSLSSGLTQPMWHFGVKAAGAAHAAIIQNLVPVFALLAAWLTIREVPTAAQWTGGTLILAGLITMRLTRK